jgi:hypothetical protein
MAEDNLPLPIEIPWKLASTTQPLASAPAETSLSLFFFEPDAELLTSQFPDDKLVFLKVTASVSPASFPAKLSRVAATFLGEGIPCFHLLLDLKVRTAAGNLGTIRPYFHAAAPLTRRMVQTGVVGIESYEGEADGLTIGKSGSQMNETLRSHSSTSSSSTSGGATAFLPIPLIPTLVSVGASSRNTSTDVSSDRGVSQSFDTTSRDASEERRELISHTTRVENIISLLNAKYVGTPHLTFSLSPQPLQQLSVDASDPNLWFQQLLARRSSGIEGIQEFTTVVVVPRGTDFCVNARLRRVCLLDSPPGPLNLDERFRISQILRLLRYLNRTFPPGTPLEELDIDIIGGLTATDFRRPVVEVWALGPDVVDVIAASSNSDTVPLHVRVNYKHILEVWLDTLRDEYEQEVARSPLERGVLFGENRELNTCFAQSEEGGALTVSSSSTGVTPLFRVDLPPGTFDIGGVKTSSTAASTRSRAIETTTRWNAIERQLATVLANRIEVSQKPLAIDDPKVLGVLIDTWAKLSPDDERNLGFEQAAALLKLNNAQRRQLKATGATDLKSIASALKAAPELERHDAEVQRVRQIFKDRKVGGTPPDLIKFAVSSSASKEITKAIGSGLAKNPNRGLKG